jgi:hypothetical protein
VIGPVGLKVSLGVISQCARISAMGGIRNQRTLVFFVSLAVWASLTACSSTTKIDLATNNYIYTSPGYEAPRSTEAGVFVQRVRDERTPPDFSKRDSIKTKFSDKVWGRSIPVMIEDVLMDEIDRSRIYNGISSGSLGVPSSRDFVIEPTLHAFYRYREAMLGGDHLGKRRSGAYGALRIRVMSPIGADGNREVLLDKVYQDLVLTSLRRGRPQEGVVLAGRAMQNIMRQAMSDIYESNIRATPGAPIKK